MTPRPILALAVTMSLTALGGIAQEDFQISAPGPDEEYFRLLTPEELEGLVGPVALHPDPLVALILPAATYPAEIVLAQRYFETNGNLDRLNDQPWDQSVRALAHYPDLIGWMDQNLAWTVRLGEAFVAQPADVMNAIQRRRSQAIEAGTLVSTAHYDVIQDAGYISIVPAQSQTIHVPSYSPAVVYVAQNPAYQSTYFRYSVGYRTGPWLAYDCDWYAYRIWYCDHIRYPNYHHNWYRPVFPQHPDYEPHPGRAPWKPRPHYGLTRETERERFAFTSPAMSDNRRFEQTASQPHTNSQSIAKQTVRSGAATTAPGNMRTVTDQDLSDSARRLVNQYTRSGKQVTTNRSTGNSKSVFSNTRSNNLRSSSQSGGRKSVVRTPAVRATPPTVTRTKSFSTTTSSNLGRSTSTRSSSYSKLRSSTSKASGSSLNRARSFTGSSRSTSTNTSRSFSPPASSSSRSVGSASTTRTTTRSSGGLSRGGSQAHER